MTFEDELKSSVVVAEASTKAFSRALLVGVVPIIEFGVLIALTALIVALPAKLLRKV
jgi:hypothetical protein|tara:strand:+ start:335 stop:505 length:171 start_codon:yes stop_codon:yes gene_type:complete